MPDLIELTKQAGIVGAGGGGFPTYKKLEAEKIENIIVNGAECEPLLYVDQELMVSEAEKLIVTLQTLLEVKGAKRGIIALKRKYEPAWHTLQTLTVGTGIELFPLPNVFPVGDEHVLVYEVLGLLIPPGGIPPMINCLVLNVETLLNIANALNNQPVTDKYVTVTGEVARPGTYRFPIGIGYKDIITYVKANIKDYMIITGGPMMGYLAEENDVVSKTTKGILILSSKHSLARNKAADSSDRWNRLLGGCCQCRLCTDFCPRNLLGHNLRPHLAMRSLANNCAQEENLVSAFLCSECGLCDLFVCPVGLSPRIVHKTIKKQLELKGYKRNKPPEKNEKVRTNRTWRQIPTERLVARLGLSAYASKPPFYQELHRVNKVSLPLKQGAGIAAEAKVKSGDAVKRGQIIAEIPSGKLGSNLHASMDGVVTYVGTSITIESLGGNKI